MNRNITSFLILIVMLLSFAALASSANAALVVNKYTNEFTASSPYNEQIKLCSCETKSDTLIVENIGDFIADFTVQAQSSYPGTIKIAEPRFTLSPKHFKELTIYVDDSCGVRGEFTYDLIITNSYGRVQTLHRTIRSDVCQTAEFYVAPDSVETGLCRPATFNVTTKNVGTFADTYSLDFGPYNNNAKVAVRDMYLLPNQEYTQQVTFTFDCKEYGVKNVPIILHTQKNGETIGLTKQIVIRNDYNFGMDLSTSAAVCTQVQTKIPVDFKNNAYVEDEIAVRLNAPGFVSLSNPSNVYLQRNGQDDSAIRNIVIQPPKGSQGHYTIGVLATDIYGGKQKQRDISLDVNNCYDPAVQIQDGNKVPIIGDIKACCGDKTFYVNVQNNGDSEQLFRLQLDAPSIFKMEENTIRVAPGQNVNVPIYASLPCTDNNYTANVLVYPVAAPHVNVSSSVTIQSLTDRSCHMVQIDDDELNIKEDTSVLPVIVRQTGLEGGTYAINMNSTVFKVLENNITLEPGDEKAIHVVPIVNLSLQERGRYITQPQFKLIDPALNIAYNEHVGINLHDKGVFERFGEWIAGLPWGQLGVCGWTIILLIILALLVLLLLILVYSGAVELPSMSKSSLTVMKTILLVLIFVLLVMVFFLRMPGKEVMYERQANNTNVQVIEWYQNEPHTIDMSAYFEDPDHDIMRYTVTQPKDMKVSIDDNMLTLTPDHNFVGQNSMIITANDNKGGITDSPTFTLRVIAKKNMTFLDWMHAWCEFIVALLCVFVLLLAFMIVLAIKQSRQDLKKDHVLVVVKKSEQRSLNRQSRRSPRAKSARFARTAAATRPARVARLQAKPKTKSKVVISSANRSSKSTARGFASQESGVVVREYQAGGKTVNLRVEQPKVAAPTIVTVPGVQQAEVIYIGSKNGNTVHTPYCMNARRIPKSKRIAYSSKREAVKAGLVPCRMCRPFEGVL